MRSDPVTACVQLQLICVGTVYTSMLERLLRGYHNNVYRHYVTSVQYWCVNLISGFALSFAIHLQYAYTANACPIYIQGNYKHCL